MFTNFVLLALALVVLLGGCAKESEPATKPIRFQQKDGGQDCLAKFGDYFSAYSKGQKSADEVTKFWACVGKAVHDYQRLTNGELAGDYTPEALRRFLQKYLIPSERQIDDAFLASLMELKRVFVGGSNAKITNDELTKLQQFITLISEITVDLNPFAKVVFLADEDASDAQVEAAAIVVERSINRVGQWLAVQNQTYRFDHMRAFVAGLGRFNGDRGQPSVKFQDLEKAFEMIPPLKQILLTGSRTGILGSEWPRAFSLLGRAYYSLVAVKFAFRDNLNAALSRQSTPRAADRLFLVLQEAAQAHPRSEIPLIEFRELFEQVEKSKLIKDVTAEGLMGALSLVLNRLILLNEGPRPEVLSFDHLQIVRNRLSDWSALRAEVLSESGMPTALGEKFDKVQSGSEPLEWDREGRMAFAVTPAREWNKFSRLNMVWPFAVLNWVRDAYVKDGRDLNENDVDVIAGEVLPMLQKFGWMKSTKVSIGRRILQEADLFTLGATGDRLLSLSEAVRYLAFVASSYQTAKIWLKATDEAAKTNPSCIDRNAACARKLAGNLQNNILSHMPRLQQWMAADNPEKRIREFTKTNEETILDTVQDRYSTGDLLQVLMIFHYVETFVRRFDTNQDTFIDLGESKPAYDIFKLTLGKLTSPIGVPPHELYGFFTFMVKFGDTPFTMMGGQITYHWWRWHQDQWEFRSNRMELAGILNKLAKLK